MPNYALYNPTSAPVSHLVTQLLKSFNEGQEGTLATPWVKNPDLTSVNTGARMRWNGTAIVNLTQAENDSIDAAQDAANIAELKQAAKDIFGPSSQGAQNQAIRLGFETMRDMMLSELNLLRAAAVPPLAARTLAQFNNTFKSTYEAKIDALS